MAVTDAEISNTLLTSARDGAYPGSENVLTAKLETTGLTASLQLIRQAKSEVETDLPAVGQQSSSNLDDWIVQAKNLREEIEHSKATAREITGQYEDIEKLSGRAEDARAKLYLLQHETWFNQVLTSTLDQISSVNRSLTEADSDLASGRLLKLAASLDHLSQKILQTTHGTAAEITHGRCSQIQKAVVEGLSVAVNSMVDFQESGGRPAVKVDHGKHASLGVSLGHLLQTLDKLDALGDLQRTFASTFYRKLCQPVLSRASGGIGCSIDETSHRLVLAGEKGSKNEQAVLGCLLSIFRFLHKQLPVGFGSAVGAHFSEELVETLIRDWLTPSLPLALSDLLKSRQRHDGVTRLAEVLVTYQWPGHEALTLWIGMIPQIWLEKRCTASLDAMRAALVAPRGPGKVVQRIERHRLQSEGMVFAGSDTSKHNTDPTEGAADTMTVITDTANADEEDLSAWDFEEDTSSNKILQESERGSKPEGGDEACSLHGAINQGLLGDESALGGENINESVTNGFSSPAEVTLTETYQITDLPDQLLDIVSGQVEEATQLKSSKYASLAGSTRSSESIDLPHQTLAIFRAIAPACYSSTMIDGSMHLYNDCIYTVERLRDLAKEKSLTQLLQDCAMLEKFAVGAYAREMDMQRTILSDLMDGAQGFVHCTIFPHSEESEKAVTSTSDRLRTVYRGWSPILSRSVLLQSVGSLLSTVIEKMIRDIEEMEDISDAESQHLAAFCGRFSALEDLFLSDGPVGETTGAAAEKVPLTAVYVPHWLRFQYLCNILESSLVDIRYLWTEGELELEFTAEEVIELIEALFAESIHRRNAIAEIRRNRTASRQGQS